MADCTAQPASATPQWEEGTSDVTCADSPAAQSDVLPPSDAPRSRWCPLDAIQLCKLGYLCGYFGYPVMGAYASLVFESKGFSATYIGLLGALAPISTVVVLPVISYFAETRRAQGFFMFASVIMSSLMLYFVVAATDQWLVFAAAVAFNCYAVAMLPLYDEHTMSVLGPSRRERWGTLRCYGAYGWGASATFTAYVFGTWGWLWTVPIWAAGFSMMLFCAYQTPVTKVVGDHRMVEVLRFAWRRKRILNYCFGLTWMGFGYSLIGTFLFVFLSTLGAPSSLFGLCLVFAVLIEIPLFQCSEFLHRTFSDRQLFLMSIAGWIARVLGYSILTNPWYVLLLEPFHGLTFGLMWLSGIHVFGAAFPAQLSNSAFGLLNATTFGVGPIIGNVVGGVLFDALGARTMFQLAACFMFVVGSLFYLFDRWVDGMEADDLAATLEAAPTATARTVGVGEAEL